MVTRQSIRSPLLGVLGIDSGFSLTVPVNIKLKLQAQAFADSRCNALVNAA